MLFLVSSEGPLEFCLSKKLHLLRAVLQVWKITDGRSDPSRVVKEHGPQYFSLLSAALCWEVTALNIKPLSHLRPCRSTTTPAALICYQFNQVCKFLMHVKLNMERHFWMRLPYQPPRSSFSIMYCLESHFLHSSPPLLTDATSRLPL